MRRLLIITYSMLVLLALFLLGAGIVLAEAGPFHPGSPLFPLQLAVEQQRASWNLNNTGRASYLLRLAERRTDDVLSSSDPEIKFQALVLLDETLDQVIGAIALVPDGMYPGCADAWQI